MKNGSIRVGAATLLLFTLVAINLVGAFLVDRATADGLNTRVQFVRDSDSATLRGAVARGDSDVYVLGARGGDLMEVSISSTENNAVFHIEEPSGGELARARSGDDATNWSSNLPRSGDYRIIVGGTRGNATYILRISIR